MRRRAARALRTARPRRAVTRLAIAVAGGPALDNNVTDGAYSWTTAAELLQDAGVSWKCYQQLYSTNTAGTQPTNVATLSSLLNNYGTNVLCFFEQFVNAPQNVPFGLYQNACFGSTLFGSPNGNGLGGQNPALTNPYAGAPFDLTTNFEEDCYNGTLPTVSWIFPPSTLSEHPAYLPAAGAQFVASKIAAVAALASPGGTPGGGLNVGAGFRVPCIIISPWTVGGYVCSDAFDHTSVLRLLETVTGITVSDISAWRRGTFGDLTSAFQSAATSPAPSIPDSSYSATSAELSYQEGQSSLGLPPFPARDQTPPAQRPGSRPSIG